MKHQNRLGIYKRVRYAVRCSGCGTRSEWNEMQDMKLNLIERFGAAGANLRPLRLLGLFGLTKLFGLPRLFALPMLLG